MMAAIARLIKEDACNDRHDIYEFHRGVNHHRAYLYQIQLLFHLYLASAKVQGLQRSFLLRYLQWLVHVFVLQLELQFSNRFGLLKKNEVAHRNPFNQLDEKHLDEPDMTQVRESPMKYQYESDAIV